MPILSETEEFRSQIEGGNLKGAAEHLLERHGADSLAVCRAMVGDADAARDLFHDAFMLACDGLAGYRGEAAPKTWFLRITHNRCIDHLRREKRRPWVLRAELGRKSEVDDGGEDWIDEGHSPEERSTADGLILDAIGLERAIGTLDERDRSLIILRYAHEMSFAELGEAFGVKPGAMRMRVQRALARLREVMEGGVGEVRAIVVDSESRMPPRANMGAPASYESGERMLAPPPPPPPPPDHLGLFVDQMRRFQVPLEKSAIRRLLESVDSFHRSPS